MTQTGYGPAQRCIFDGDEDKYEQWECKMLAYMKLRKLKHVILPGAPASAEKKEECFSELVGLLDDRSLNLIMRDAQDDGRRALEILRAHYAGTGKQRILSLISPKCWSVGGKMRFHEFLIDIRRVRLCKTLFQYHIFILLKHFSY